jgi:formylglycine-generating enzyme required for sulfatase activity
MVVLPATAFIMGSPDDEKGHNPNEGPQHSATALSANSNTFEEWDACVDYGDCDPHIESGWRDAADGARG